MQDAGSRFWSWVRVCSAEVRMRNDGPSWRLEVRRRRVTLNEEMLLDFEGSEGAAAVEEASRSELPSRKCLESARVIGHVGEDGGITAFARGAGSLAAMPDRRGRAVDRQRVVPGARGCPDQGSVGGHGADRSGTPGSTAGCRSWSLSVDQHLLPPAPVKCGAGGEGE